MVRVLFVCLGNICRSPMAEFVMKDLVAKQNLSKEFYIESAGTSSEEEGSPVHRGTREKLAEHGISCAGKRARPLTFHDYWEFDYILCAESRNVFSAIRRFGGDPHGKVKRLLDFAPTPRDIADPWYTGDFEASYRDIAEGCACFLQTLRAEGKIK